MKFLLELVTCSGSCSSGNQQPAEETKFLVVPEPRRRVGRRQGRVSGAGREWRPSLTSISEDVLAAERINNVERPVAVWRRSLKRKVSSSSARDRTRSSDYDDRQRATVSAAMPTFSTPFMF